MEKTTNRTKDVLLVWLFLFFGLLISKNALSQSQRVTKMELNPLSTWVGTWEGEGWSMDEQMQKQTFQLVEEVESKIDGLAIAMDAKGVNAQGAISHHAYGLVMYDIDRMAFIIQSLTKDGYVMRSEGKLDAGILSWQVDVPHGQLRYSIQVKGNEWIEKGAYSEDGSTWWPFMEFKMTKK